MPKYAHVKDGAVLKIITLTDAEVALIPAHKATYILPYVEVARPAHDPATQIGATRLPDVVNAGVNVTQAWSAVQGKSQSQMDAEDVAEKDNAATRATRDNSIEKALAETMFEIAKAAKSGDWSGFELADGTPVTTKAHFLNYMKEKM